MATAPNTNINIPYSPFLNDQTGRPNQEWLQWLMNPQFITVNLGSALPVTSGGTGLTTIPTNGQLLIGNGTGYTLNPLTPGAGIGVTNGVGAITVANTGVLSNIAGTGISVSSATGNVTIANTGVLSWSGGSTGLTPATATTGAVSLAGTLGAGYGGTGLSTYAVGDLLYASGATALSRLADVATGNALISGGVTTAPNWGKIGLTTHVSGTLPIGNGGTNATATPTAGAIAYGTGSAYAFTAAGTSGQVLTSAGAGTPTWATPTTGTVTAVSVVSANGLAGTSSGGATPALTLSTTVTGVVKGNGTALSAATAATDYVAPSAYASANGLTMATARLLGRTTASTGAAEEISVAGGLTLSGGTLTGTSGTVTAVSVVSANGLAGSSSGGATPAITLSTTITGLLKGNGTAISAATSGTDYAPATSGTSILYGNGSGGFSNVTIGTGVSFAAGTLSATGSGGTVTSVTGTAPVVSSGGTTPAISMAAATTSVNGYLTSTDWTTFNGKQAALVSGTNIKTVNGTTLLGSGDVGTITYAYGGTGQTTVTTGDLLYGSASNVWSKLGIGTTGQILRVVSGAPAWGTDYTGTVTSVGGTGTVNGLSLSGTVTSSGNLTLGGTLDLSSPPAIGETSPSTGKFTTLTATGTLSSGAITSSGNSAFGGATADTWRSAYRAITLHSTGQNLFASTGNTGISSNIYNGAALGDWTYAATGTGAVYQQSGGVHYFQCAPSGSAGTLATLTTPLIISNTGIITMSAYGAGAATFSAAGVISSVSDETWKVKDGAPVDTDAMLNKLEPGYWYYNDEKKETFGKDRQLGFYAQNVNAAIGPEAAPEPEEGKPWGYYDRSVLAVTVMSLQKSLATIESLTARITALEAK